MGLLVKICGLSTPDAMAAALEAGADMVGLNFFPPSPRYLSLKAAAQLAEDARGRAEIVAVTVDADDATIEAICASVRPDWLQLHGHEPHVRVETLRASGRRVMKALGVATSDDLAQLAAYPSADRFLLDAKAPPDARLPGGNGVAFDWGVLARSPRPCPFMLSGGLTPTNVADAIAALSDTALVGVDVSSGVERAPGVKDPARIAAFVAAVRAASVRATRAPAQERVA